MKKQVFNPYLPEWEYVPDGEPRVFGGRLYVFGSHDRFDGERYCMNDYVSWSAPVDDLSNWRYDGVIYRATQDPLNADGAMQLFAPDVVQGIDGRFYLYYGLSFRNAISVAVSYTPSGKYLFLGNVSYPDGTVLGERQGDRFQFDPGVLVDDDGRVYLYSGFSPGTNLQALLRQHIGVNTTGEGSMVYELNSDMKTVKLLTSSVAAKPLIPGWENASGTDFEGHEFFEASSIRKFDGIYYFIYSSILSHELCYATSAFPDRDFSYRGVLHSNGDLGIDGLAQARNYWGNNHGSLVRLNGEYFVFGHRQTNAHEFSRQGVVEKLTRDSNGDFIQAEMSSCGLNGKPLAGKGRYGAGIACNLQSAEGACKTTESVKEFHPFITQDAPDYDPDGAGGAGGTRDTPSQYIANMRDGSAAGFKRFALEYLRKISVEVRGDACGELVCGFVREGDSEAAISVPITVVASDEWRVFSAEAVISDGVYGLSFVYKGAGGLDFKSFTLE